MFTAINEPPQDFSSASPIRRTSHNPTVGQWQMLCRLQELPDDESSLRAGLCRAYLMNNMGPNEFLDALAEAGVLVSLGHVLTAYATGILALTPESPTP